MYLSGHRAKQSYLRLQYLGRTAAMSYPYAEIPAGELSNQLLQFGISWPPRMTEKRRGLLYPGRQIPVCRFVRQHPQSWCLRGCPVGNRSSHRHSFRVSNALHELENTGRPAIHLRLCNIPAASSGRMGECARPATNRFEGTGVVLEGRLTRGNLYHIVARSKSRILN